MRGLLRGAARAVAGSRSVARRLFGIEFLPAPGARYFDLTTPVLVSVAAPALGPGKRLLDMGTGGFATVGLALWRRTGCEVVATDVTPALVDQARASVRANGAPVQVTQARFFDGVGGEFDCVTFNVPYVPSALLSGPDVQSDGGPEGTSVVEGFLAAFAEKGGRAVAYLGVNPLLVPRGRIAALVGRHPDLVLREVRRRRPWPAEVYVIARRGPRI